MLRLETNVRRIVARLEREGWINIGVAGQYRFVNRDFPGVMIVCPAEERTYNWRGAIHCRSGGVDLGDFHGSLCWDSGR